MTNNYGGGPRQAPASDFQLPQRWGSIILFRCRAVQRQLLPCALSKAFDRDREGEGERETRHGDKTNCYPYVSPTICRI